MTGRLVVLLAPLVGYHVHCVLLLGAGTAFAKRAPAACITGDMASSIRLLIGEHGMGSETQQHTCQSHLHVHGCAKSCLKHPAMQTTSKQQQLAWDLRNTSWYPMLSSR